MSDGADQDILWIVPHLSFVRLVGLYVSTIVFQALWSYRLHDCTTADVRWIDQVNYSESDSTDIA